jgi:hypothetical protein
VDFRVLDGPARDKGGARAQCLGCSAHRGEAALAQAPSGSL